MERRQTIIVAVATIILTSCIKISDDSIPIERNKIYGCYASNQSVEHLCLYQDSTFFYYTQKKGINIIQNGRYYYRIAKKWNVFELDENEIICKTTDSIDVNIIINDTAITQKVVESHRFRVCYDHIFFGNIILTRGYQDDPDGAPALKWLHKVD